jgi:hypothetical protein
MLGDIGPGTMKVVTVLIALMFIWWGVTGLMRHGYFGGRRRPRR